jgi:hypothetical protein
LEGILTLILLLILFPFLLLSFNPHWFWKIQ